MIQKESLVHHRYDGRPSCSKTNPRDEKPSARTTFSTPSGAVNSLLLDLAKSLTFGALDARNDKQVVHFIICCFP